MKKLEKVQVVTEVISGRLVTIAATWLDARLAAQDLGYQNGEYSIKEWKVKRYKK